QKNLSRPTCAVLNNLVIRARSRSDYECYAEISMQLEKVYEPQRFEPHWAQWWIDSQIYHVDAKQAKPGRTFSIVITPPNVTASLHIGHMLEHTIMDAAVRWHRMKGDTTLWLPGTDH